jgi:hypothetical protein
VKGSGSEIVAAITYRDQTVTIVATLRHYAALRLAARDVWIEQCDTTLTSDHEIATTLRFRSAQSPSRRTVLLSLNASELSATELLGYHADADFVDGNKSRAFVRRHGRCDWSSVALVVRGQLADHLRAGFSVPSAHAAPVAEGAGPATDSSDDPPTGVAVRISSPSSQRITPGHVTATDVGRVCGFRGYCCDAAARP